MSNEQIDGNKSSGYLDTIDIPQAQTADRLKRHREALEAANESAEARRRSEKRWAWLIVLLACGLVAVVIVGQIILEAGR